MSDTDKKTNWSFGLVAALGGALAGAGAVALFALMDVAPQQRTDIEKVVREYILANPEIIREAAQALQAKEIGQVVAANRAAFETPYAGAWAGAENGDVVLVEFFDYACGFCRKSNADVERLLKEDKGLKVVWREFPVLGEDSLAAAEASLAAARQNKFKPFHDALFASGRPNAASIAAARTAAGVTTETARVNARAEIERNYELARSIGGSGTPIFVVGDQVLPGAVGYDALKAAIAAARAR